jgi:hypothetical protein
MKPTNKNLSQFFEVAEKTIHNWKTERPRVYKALKEHYKKLHPVKKIK